MKQRITVFILIIVLLTQVSRAQIANNFTSNIYITPAITIGYTFRCGWNYGIDITIGFQKVLNALPNTSWGLNLQHYIINYHSDRHSITAFNLVIDNSITQFGLGMGAISKTWGYKKVNKDRAFGISTIFNLGTGNFRYPWLGISTFIPSDSWTWSSLPYYISYHFFWRQEPIFIKK